MAEQTFHQPVGIKKETTRGTPVTPDVYVPCYSESLSTKLNLITDAPAFGKRLARYQTLQGNRTHSGSLSVMAEPNTAARFLDMVASRTATSGSDPYTHTYAESATDPNSYTVDVVKGAYAVRYFGVEGSKIGFGFDGDKMKLDLDVSARGSFYPREIASVSGTGPYTCVLDTAYDPSPTTGLVASDAIKFYDVSAGTYITATVASIVNGTSFTTSTDISSLAAGDMVMLAPATPSLSLLTPFLWGRTQFFFAADAATALSNSATSSNQTRLEPGTSIELMNPFDQDGGTNRSGSFDPASLPRSGGYDVRFSPKVFLDTPEKNQAWAALEKRALVMRAYSGTAHELRVTLNDIRNLTNETPGEAGGILYHEYEYAINYDSTDTQAFDFKVINGVSSI